jgi:hypothetical protein
MTFDFLIDTYDTERLKVLSVWSEFRDDDLSMRPRNDDSRGRSVLEQMVLISVATSTLNRRKFEYVASPPIDVGRS